MTETANPKKKAHLPNMTSDAVRRRWTELLDLSYAMRRVSEQEIEPGVHAVIVPASYCPDDRKDLVDAEVQAASGRVPAMARGVRLSLERLGEFALAVPANYREWMGERGQDIATGATRVTAFVDLAYLEAALLARLWDAGVLVEFDSPLAFLRRGALSDYVNIYEAVVEMVFAGRSLADTAGRLAPEIVKRLQLYANTYHQLCSLYPEGAWHIDRDNFVMKVPGTRFSLSLQYWELRGDPATVQKVLQDWRNRIEDLLRQALSDAAANLPNSFAA